MNITDGAIMFIACLCSFAIGYTIGAIRVGRYVNRRLDQIKGDLLQIQERSQELRQIYSKLEGENTQP